MEPFKRLIEIVKSRHPTHDPSHDFLHIERVTRKCELLGTELGARLDILIPAALLHDIVAIPKSHPDRVKASDLAAKEAKQILEQLNLFQDDIESILRTIQEHSFSAGRAPTSLESAILQDADRLDALGAIGIARTFSCGTLMGSQFYEAIDPFAANRALVDQLYMVDHFFSKLLKLAEKMNTTPAKIESAQRIKFIHLFLEQLKGEINPNHSQATPLRYL